MRKFSIFFILVLFLGTGFPTYAPAEVSPQTSEKQDRQKELIVASGFDIRKEMIERGEITFPTQPRVGLNASHVPETSIRAASRLAALPGKQFVKHFYINWGPRNLPRSILNFMRPLTDADSRTPLQLSKSFLKRHRYLFKLSPVEVDNTIIEKNYKTKHNGARHVVLLQAVHKVPVYKGRMSFHYNRQGQLVLMHINDVVPGLSINTDPTLNEVQAVKAAVSSLGKSLPAEPVLITPRVKKEDIAILKNPFGGKVKLRLMVFPIGNSGRLAWWMQLDLKNGSEWYEMLIDANNGELLYRNNLYAYIAHGRVFTDNPNRGARQYLEFPAAWLGGIETEGNNVDAYEDHDGDDTTHGDRAVSTAAAPNQVFDFPWGDGLTNQDPRNFTNAAITNLFYFVNLYHDYAYDLGFDEVAGNFQEDNFGLGGAEGDRVLAEAQDAGSISSAYMGTPVDGDSPRMKVGIIARTTYHITTDDLDCDVSGDIIFHESTHGLSARLVGGPTTTSCLRSVYYLQGAAMSEGWSDFIACNFFNDPVLGEYYSQDFAKGLRREAYNNQPRTYADLNDEGSNVRHDGEIWGAALWDLREALRTAYGPDAGRQMVAQLVVDGMKLTPCFPSFIDGRNAILMADQLNNGAANKCLIWEVFAARGMGFNAEGDSYHTHNADFSTSPACETLRDPVDIVLVLDHSGSMDDPAPGGSQDKIDLLKDAVELFVRGWTPYAVAGDKIGVVYFESNVSQHHTPLLIDFLGNEQNVIDDVRSHNPEVYTAMGGGLQTAINQLVSSSNNKKHLILFTDGMQNCSPMVRELPADGTPPEPNHDIREEPVSPFFRGEIRCDSGVAGAPGVSLESYLTNNNIRIHTIGTGVSGVAWQNLLTNIANETDGENYFTSDPDLDLFRFYEENLVTSLAGNTLELVKYKTAVMKKGKEKRTEKFTINTAAKRASFILSWRNPSGKTKLRVFFKNPDGHVVSPGQKKSSDYYHIATFDFPIFRSVVNGDRTWFDHRGVWEMVIIEENIQGAEVVYDASLLVDEAKLDYQFKVVKKDYGTGEDILLTARVTEDETPVRTLDKTQVVVKRPKTGIGTFISTHPVSKDDLDKDLYKHKDLFPSMVDKKTYILVQEAANRQKLAPAIETIFLYDDGTHGDQTAGDGLYSTLFKETSIPGTYTFNFHVEGKTFRSGKFSRNRLVSAQVRVKKPNIEDTKIDMKILEKNRDFYTIRISVIPFDRFKNYLGPGYSRYVQITASDGTFGKPVEDRLDGSYSRDLTLYDFSKDPNISINVQGVNVYNDPLSRILEPSPVSPVNFGIKAGLNFANLSSSGSSTPVFDWTNKTGFCAGAYLSFKLSGFTAVQPEVLFSRKGLTVDQAVVTSTFNIDFIEMPLLLKFTLLPGSSISPCLFGGPFVAFKLNDNILAGIGVPPIKKVDYGIAFGGGFDLKLGGNTLTLEARYTMGLKNIADVPAGSNITIKSKVLSFMIGLEF